MYNKLFFIFVILTLSFTFSSKAQAATITPGPLVITYPGEGSIFSESNFEPGNKVSQELTVTNNGRVAHNLAIGTRNITGELAQNIQITPLVADSAVWTLNINELLSSSNESRTIVALNPGETKTIILSAYFSELNSDSKQNKNVNFDIVFGTEETEPSNINALGVVLTPRLSATDTASPEASQTPSATVTADPQVKGEQAQDSNDANPYYLLLLPAALLATAVLIPEFLFVVGATALAGGFATVLGARSTGTMPFNLFEILITAEIIALFTIAYFLLHHDNRASRKIKAHRHRLRIR